jgi:hypothetical protein
MARYLTKVQDCPGVGSTTFDSDKEAHTMAKLAVPRYVRPWRDVVIITLALLAFAAAPALGARVTQAPTVSGNPASGNALLASIGAWTPAGATATYGWLRCGGSGAACAPISGACGRRYKVRTADEGHTLRVRLTVTDSAGPGSADSAPTAKVEPDAYRPFVNASDTCTQVTPTGPGQGTFTSGEQTGSGTVPPPETSLAFIDPFPVVRFSGRFTRKRTKLTRVFVNAPSGTRIRVSCAGRGCPYRRKAVAVKLVRIRKLQRSYRPNSTIEIRVTQPQKIGKYTRVKTRKGKAPLRIDRCLMPASTRPVPCPTA